MKFDLNDLNPGIWFDHTTEDGRICVRAMPVDELTRAQKTAGKRKTEYKRGQRFSFIEMDDQLYNELIWDYCVVDWENITDFDGVSLECSRDNKIKLMNQSVIFAEWVGKCIEDVTNAFESELEKSLEN